ncbi:SpoIIE family protein phosphatase [Kitasatospora arboriphila]|uniref:SpoIIE family protein phosphatase n=1 Tax=Kitasatospora arboriphila TaxID=258052 RepID=UPI0031DEAEFF
MGTDYGHPPPRSLTEPAGSGVEVETFAFREGDTVLLHPDGVTAARDGSGAFHPLTERLAGWPPGDPRALLRLLRQDLLDHVGGRLH